MGSTQICLYFTICWDNYILSAKHKRTWKFRIL